MADSYDEAYDFWHPQQVAVQPGDHVRAKVLGWDSNVFEVGVEIPEDPVVEGIFETNWIELAGCWDFLVDGESVDPATLEALTPSA